jgi:type I restriction enzyme M protein
VIAYSGEKKEQEDFLGYRFSSSRGKEGIELLVENGVLKTALYDLSNPSNPEKVSTHIRTNFMGNQIPVPKELENRVRYMPTTQLLDADTYQLKNPSGFFQSEHIAVTSNSPLGDVIDDFDQK